MELAGGRRIAVGPGSAEVRAKSMPRPVPITAYKTGKSRITSDASPGPRDLQERKGDGGMGQERQGATSAPGVLTVDGETRGTDALGGRMGNTYDRLLTGAAAGFAATGPMTAVMEALHTLLPREEQDPLPPRQVMERGAEAAGVEHELDDEGTEAATAVAHFGFGTAAGALLGLLAARSQSPTLAGVGYGLGVWAASYLGILPAAGLYKSARNEPARRHGLMIAAHVVWGAVAGKVLQQLARDQDGEA